jgi:hypothetical protein
MKLAIFNETHDNLSLAERMLRSNRPAIAREIALECVSRACSDTPSAYRSQLIKRCRAVINAADRFPIHTKQR